MAKKKPKKANPKKKTGEFSAKRVIRSSDRNAKPKSVLRDRWVKCVVADGNIRAVAIDATQVVRDLAKRHKLEGLGAQGLGEAVVSALLIASSCKGEERVNLNIQGAGAFAQALVDASADGAVRGYVIQVPKYKPPTEKDAPGPWGKGLLSVLRTKGKGEPPYIGTVPLVTGHLAKDLTFYWFQSEQVPSAVGLGVYTDGEKVLAAGGFLVQALPGARDSELSLIQRHLLTLHDLKETFVETHDPVRILAEIFQEQRLSIVEEKPLRFSCDCSVERVERSLMLIGVQELKNILAEDGKATVTCDFCSTEYKVEKKVLERLINTISS